MIAVFVVWIMAASSLGWIAAAFVVSSNNHHHRHGTTSTASRRTPTTTPTTTTALFYTHGPVSVRPIGMGHAVPPTVLTNTDLEHFLDTSDEWIRSRTGIVQRHVLTGPDARLRDVTLEACQRALDMAGVSPQELDVVIHASSTPDDLYGDGPSIAAALECTTDTVAFDITAACSGFLFATITASHFLRSSTGGKTTKKKALVVGAESMSRWVDWQDRNLCILFGDGAGAMVLEASDDEPGILGYSMHSNGNDYRHLNSPYHGKTTTVNTPGSETELQVGGFAPLRMAGKDVYKFATREVPIALQEAIDAAGLTVQDVDHLLLHQANTRIMDVVAERLGIPAEKVICNLPEYGNTSSASIPIALDGAVRSGRVKKGDLIACAGFGAGLSWGAALIRWGGEPVD